MKLLKEYGNPISDAINAAEAILNSAGVFFYIVNNQIIFDKGEKTYVLINVEDGEPATCFPRLLESQRFKLIE